SAKKYEKKDGKEKDDQRAGAALRTIAKDIGEGKPGCKNIRLGGDTVTNFQE
ncbi:unnamed protein product, partial [Effrenium voratum]